MPASVIPTCRVTSRSVIDFWVDGLGLELLSIHPEDAGDTVDHAELGLGEGRLMAGTVRGNDVDRPTGTMSLYWVLDAEADVDAAHARAVGAGGASVLAPYDADYGGRHCTVADPDGNLWSFGTYRGSSSK